MSNPPIRKQIMALPVEIGLGIGEDYPDSDWYEGYAEGHDDAKVQCADLAEARERELLAELEQVKVKAMNNDLMACCMDATRQELINAGIFADSVPPMFVTDAVLGYIGKLKAERAQMIAELRQWQITPIRAGKTFSVFNDILNKYEVKK